MIFFKRRKIKNGLLNYWLTREIKAQIDTLAQQDFLETAFKNESEVKELLKAEQRELEEIEMSHKYENRKKKEKIQDKIDGFHKVLGEQEKEILKGNKIIEQSKDLIVEAQRFIEVIKYSKRSGI